MSVDNAVSSSTHRVGLRRPSGPAERTGGLLSSVGYGLRFLVDPIGFVGGRFAKYGDLYFAPSSGVGLYVVRHHEHVRDVLVTHAERLAKTHTAFESLSPVLGSGLLTSDGDVWKRHRRLANPAFAKRAIDGYVPSMVEISEAAANGFVDGETCDLAPRMTDLTLRIVGRTLFGTDVAEDIATIGRAMTSFQRFLVVPPRLPKLVRAPIQKRVDAGLHDLDGLVTRMLLARRTARVDPPDLTQMLLDAAEPSDGASVQEDAPRGLTAREIRDEIVTFLLAGHETTSNTLTWAFDCLARHPRVERRLREELRRVVGQRPISNEDLPRLEYTSAVIKETMRLYPPAYVLARRATEDVVIGGFDVPRGSEVIVWTYFTHRDPLVYPEPEQFRPERFFGEDEARIPKCAYVPFGAGPRACIGKTFAMAEAVVALASIARQWSFVPLRSRAPRPAPRITLAAKGGVPVRVHRVS